MSSMLTTLALSDSMSKEDRLRKYSPDQERDDHGRFGSGGSSEESNRTGMSAKANTASKDARAQERSAAKAVADQKANPSDAKALMAVTRLSNAARDHEAAASAHHTASGFYRYASSNKLVDANSADAHTKAAIGHGNAAESLRSQAEAVYNQHFGAKR